MQQSEAEKTIEEITQILEKEGLKTKPARAEEGRGDLAIHLFEAIQKGKKDEIVKKLSEDKKLAESIKIKSAENNYLNLEFTRKFHEKNLSQKKQKGEWNGKTAVVEFSSPNIGKPLHVGHIRSTILGDSIRRIMEKTGWKAYSVNYPGDSGRQVALMILAMKKLKMNEIENERQLLETYVQINKEVEESEELKKKVEEITEKIEKGDVETLETIKKITDHSMKIFEKAYSLLNVKFDDVRGESQFIESGVKIAKECEKKGITNLEDGAVVVKLEKEGLPNTILMRSNGTTVYITRDLAWADYKNEKYHPDVSVYVTDSRQNTHFQQLFKIIELLGRNYVKTLNHVSYGFMTFQGKTLATRSGNTLLLEDMLNESKEEALKEIEKNGKRYGEKEKNEISQKVGVAALKFTVLRVRNEKNISFNPKQSVNFEGDTGAYLQYTHARITSIIKKAAESKQTPTEQTFELNEDEKRLACQIAFYLPTLKQAEKELSPHIIAEYALKTAHLFNTFYATSPVIKTGSEFRLQLVKKTEETLKECLETLGIDALEKM